MLRKGGLPLLPDAGALEQVRWWSVAGYWALLTAAVFFRSRRWGYLLRPVASVPARRAFAVSLIGFAAILFAPLRMGELVRPYLISNQPGLSFAQATGTVAAERIIDGLVLSIFLFLGLQLSTPLSPLPEHVGKLSLPVAAVPASAYAALTLFTAAFVAMGVFYWRRETARKLTHAVVGVVSERLADWLTTQVERVADGLRFLPDARNGVPFLRDTLLYWICNATAMWVLLQGCGVPASFAQALVTMGVLGVGILLPAGPGFFGAFQLSIYSGLAMFFPETIVIGPGAAFVFLLYSGQVLMSLFGGMFGMWLEHTRPQQTQAPAPSISAKP